jgi:hypothetical protein
VGQPYVCLGVKATEVELVELPRAADRGAASAPVTFKAVRLPLPTMPGWQAT